MATGSPSFEDRLERDVSSTGLLVMTSGKLDQT